MPPTLFQIMIDQKLAKSDILSVIGEVQKQKEVALENEVIEIPESIKTWIDKSITHFEETESSFSSGDKSNWDELNEIMLEWSV